MAVEGHHSSFEVINKGGGNPPVINVSEGIGQVVQSDRHTIHDVRTRGEFRGKLRTWGGHFKEPPVLIIS